MRISGQLVQSNGKAELLVELKGRRSRRSGWGSRWGTLTGGGAASKGAVEGDGEGSDEDECSCTSVRVTVM